MAHLRRSVRDRSLAAAVPEPATLQPARPAPAAHQTPLALAESDGGPDGDAGGRPAGRRVFRRTWLAALVSVVILPVAVAAAITYSVAGSSDRLANAAAARVVSAADMEQEYGIKVNLVAVTASGGLVDLRFTVIDKAKAARVLHDEAELPELFVEARGAVLRAPKAKAHKMTVLDGASYFLLYPNSGGVIQAGTDVSVVIDGIRLEPLDAQS